MEEQALWKIWQDFGVVSTPATDSAGSIRVYAHSTETCSSAPTAVILRQTEVPEVLNVQMNESEKKKKNQLLLCGIHMNDRKHQNKRKKINLYTFLEGKLPLRIIHIKHRQPH